LNPGANLPHLFDVRAGWTNSGACNWLDLAPKGRKEDGLAFTMAWVRHHVRCEDGCVVDAKQRYLPAAVVAAACCADGEHHKHS